MNPLALLAAEALRAIGYDVADRVVRSRADFARWLVADPCRAATYYAAMAEGCAGLGWLFALPRWWYRYRRAHWRARCIASDRHRCDAMAESATAMVRALKAGEPTPVVDDSTEPLSPPDWAKER